MRSLQGRGPASKSPNSEGSEECNLLPDAAVSKDSGQNILANVSNAMRELLHGVRSGTNPYSLLLAAKIISTLTGDKDFLFYML